MMEFDLNKSIQVLKRTPLVMEALLSGINDEWIHSNEGENTWSPYDVIGHLIHGDKTDWIPRMQIILAEGADKKFELFDRFAQFEQSMGKNINQLLEEFRHIRQMSIV